MKNQNINSYNEEDFLQFINNRKTKISQLHKNESENENFNELKNITNIEIKSNNGIIESFGYDSNLKYSNWL